MTDRIFRPVEFWKSAVITMPENSFFELMRSVFGKIKTPFNKQQLINDLEVFLLREDIQKTIASYIDKNDTKIIAAVAAFDEPSPEELETFFEEELNCAQLQDIIVNLEERFILYRFNGEKPQPKESVSRLALNPVLEQVLLPFTEDIPALFTETPVKAGSIRPSPAPKAVINDRILAALFSFVSQNKPFYKTEGVIRKKITEAAKICFPGIDLPFLTGSLQILGLFYVDKDNLAADINYFRDFSALSARERSEYCAAALFVYSESDSQAEILHPLFRNRIKEISDFIHHFLNSLEADFLYPKQFIKRLIEILKRKTGITISSDKILEVLEKTGLLTVESRQYKQLGTIAENAQEINKESPFIAIDSGSSILVYPEIDFTGALELAAVTNIQEAGEVVRFKIDKDSVVRAFDNNISADKIIGLLKRLSYNRVDDALIWNLKDWEKRYNEVSLRKGIVLTLSQERQYLVKTMPLTDLISETLAPGVYFLPENAADQAAAALQAAGIDIIARRREKPAASIPPKKHFQPSSSRSVSEKILPVSGKDFAKPLKHEAVNSAIALTETFRDILKKLPIDEPERAELSARIDRRLILCETQLREADIRYEKLEARHMDYTGKQNIAKQAITQQSPVEIVWGGTGKEKSLLGIPSALEKEDGEFVLVINPAGKDELIRIPLAKISLLRRIKKSIFET